MYNHQLDTFVCVVEQGSFNKAAQKLYISTSAVIKQINSLEDSLDMKLFKRTHRGLVLTEAGKSLYKDSKYIIKYCKDSIIRARQADHQPEILRIGHSALTQPNVFLDKWNKVEKEASDLKISVIPFENNEENAREILGHLGDHIDVVSGIFDEQLLSLRGCLGYELSEEPICIALSNYHPLARKESINIEDLYDYNILIPRRGWSSHMDQIREDFYDTPIHFIDFNSYTLELFNHCVNSEDLLLVINSWKDVHPLIRILPVNWNYTISFGILYSTHPSNKVKRLIQLLSETK